MHRKNIILISALVLFFVVLGVAQSPKTTTPTKSSTTSTTPKTQTAKKQTLLFFMNPHGRPCQMQDSVILSMGTGFSSKATVVYYKTTEMAVSEAAFRKFGVRALPTLILLDGHGNVKKRFTPGIYDASQLAAALK